MFLVLKRSGYRDACGDKFKLEKYLTSKFEKYFNFKTATLVHTTRCTQKTNQEINTVIKHISFMSGRAVLCCADVI